jgi:hypothetical protein
MVAGRLFRMTDNDKALFVVYMLVILCITWVLTQP